MTDAGSALKALDEAQAVRARLADKTACPPVFHFIFGALMGSVIAAQAGPPVVVFSVEGACLLAVVGIVTFWKRRMGYFVNGYRRGKTRPVIFALLAVYVATLALSIWLKTDRGVAWAPLAGGAFMFVAATWASFIWQKVYRAELTAQSR